MRRLTIIAAVVAVLTLGVAALPGHPHDGAPGTGTAEAHGAKYPWVYSICTHPPGMKHLRERHIEINVSTSAVRQHDVTSILNCLFCGVRPDTSCRIRR